MRMVKPEHEGAHLDGTSRRTGTARRDFLRSGAGTLAAASGLTRPLGGLLSGAAAQEGAPVDITTATFTAGIELASATSYELAAGRGLLDPVNGGLAATFLSHHRDHAATLNALLQAEGEPPVTQPDATFLGQFGAMIVAAVDVLGLLNAAYAMESAVASTYVEALGMLTVPEASLAMAQILPVESQHALVLATALSRPLEEQLPAFESTDASVLEP